MLPVTRPILALLVVLLSIGAQATKTRTISALELLASAKVLQNAIGSLDDAGWTATMQPEDNFGEAKIKQFEGFEGLRGAVDVLPGIKGLDGVDDVANEEEQTASKSEVTSTEELSPLQECREPAIEEFPKDLFTKAQLQSGWITIHILVTIYLFYALAIVCDDYFVPSVEIMAKALNIPSEIAGCTILGISNSSPELFTNIIATFVAKGDLGISSIVGASVFNLFAVAASIGIICRKNGAKIEWYPLSRDSLVYIISVGVLALILGDNHVHWYDGLVLVLMYCAYIVVIIFNKRTHAFVKSMLRRVKYCCQGKRGKTRNCMTTVSTLNSLNSVISSPSKLDEEEDEEQPIPEEFDEATMPIWPLPYGESYFYWAKFIIGWPIRLVYKGTVPDCKIPTVRKWFPVTLFACIVWNTILCYLLGWMVTVIGWTFGIPDTVMGITLFAMGTSVPQAVSSIIVARRGMGTMAMNNAIGSNIFNILVCLGVPWMIQTLILVGDSTANERYIVMSSRALGYTAFILIGCMVGLYVTIALNRFTIDLKVGLVALGSYVIAITLASLFELNVFMDVNLPLCKD